jgi:cell shape-determining protein MreC
MERELAARSAVVSELQGSVDELIAKVVEKDGLLQELEREKEKARQQMAQAAAIFEERDKTMERIKELETDLGAKEAKIRLYEVRAFWQHRITQRISVLSS